jgi:hypothetical protein
VDELDHFRDFRAWVPPASDEARQRASQRLRSAIAAERTRGTSNGLRAFGKRAYMIVACAALVGVSAIALFVSAPWKASPGFLERAQAALAPPAGTVLHMKWEEGIGAINRTCVVTRFGPGMVSRGPHEVWVDQEPPHNWRLVMARPDGSGECGPDAVKRDEWGGDLDSGAEFLFVPPNQLAVWPLGEGNKPPDPVTELRDAISAGRAHLEGKTRLDGRTVERIRIEPVRRCPTCPLTSGYVYVDPETFHLVGTDSPSVTDRAGRTGKHVRRYVTYEYLPRTPSNIALADIRAQHPNARP